MKQINLEVANINKEEGYVELETEDGRSLEMNLDFLPDNLKEGRFLRFVISHTDYDPYKEDTPKSKITAERDFIPNGRQLSY